MNPQARDVYVIDAATKAVIDTVFIGPAIYGPGQLTGIAVNPGPTTNTIYVATYNNGQQGTLSIYPV
ncbi:MAG: hypothetical protein WCH82_15100 [Mycobacteriaceae bacterium]